MNLTHTPSAVIAAAASLLGITQGALPASASSVVDAPGSITQPASEGINLFTPTGGRPTCTDSPPQEYTLFPLRGCSMYPYSNPRWANESCFGDTGAYHCREVAGHPQLNLAPQANWLVYKTDVTHYSGYTQKWGMELVHRGGFLFEGCGTWVHLTHPDGSTNYTTVCDYKMNMDNTGPRITEVDPGGWNYFYETLRNWGRNTYENEFSCAVTITGTWTGATDLVDIAPACGGVFR